MAITWNIVGVKVETKENPVTALIIGLPLSEAAPGDGDGLIGLHNP